MVSGGYLGDKLGFVIRDFQTIDGLPCLKVTQKGSGLETLMRGPLSRSSGIQALAQARAAKSKSEIVAMMWARFPVLTGNIKSGMVGRVQHLVDAEIIKEALKNHEGEVPVQVSFEVYVPGEVDLCTCLLYTSPSPRD